MAKGFWKKLEVLVTGYDSDKAHAEFEAVKAAFDALPKPKNEIPSTLRKVTW
jgi:hypothetical protein